MRSKIPAHFYRAERGREIDFTLYFELYIQLMHDQYDTIRICSIDDLGNTRMRIFKYSHKRIFVLRIIVNRASKILKKRGYSVYNMYYLSLLIY